LTRPWLLLQGRERDREEDQCLHAQHVGDQRLGVIVRGHRGDQELDRRQAPVQQQEHPEHLPDPSLVEAVGLDQRGGEALPVQKGKRGHHRLGHRIEPVISRGEQANDEDRRGPSDDLGENLGAPSPRERAAQAAREPRFVVSGNGDRLHLGHGDPRVYR
jgi:hypothetical protein